jgi:hypothetical protein
MLDITARLILDIISIIIFIIIIKDIREMQQLYFNHIKLSNELIEKYENEIAELKRINKIKIQ